MTPRDVTSTSQTLIIDAEPLEVDEIPAIKHEEQPYPTNQISHINSDDSIIMKINIPPGAKAIMFFIVLIFTSNFELHLCIFNGSCTFIFWVWIQYVKSESSGQFRLLRKVRRVVWGKCRRRGEETRKVLHLCSGTRVNN